MLARLHVVIESEEDKDYEIIKNKLLEIYPSFSISASREFPGMKNCSDFYITCELKEEDIRPLLDKLNNDWDGDEGSYDCYGFNTKMFDPLVYYMSFDVFD